MSGLMEERDCMRPGGAMCPPACRETCPDWKMLQEINNRMARSGLNTDTLPKDDPRHTRDKNTRKR